MRASWDRHFREGDPYKTRRHFRETGLPKTGWDFRGTGLPKTGWDFRGTGPPKNGAHFRGTAPLGWGLEMPVQAPRLGTLLESFWGPLKPFFGVIFSCLYWGWSSERLLEASGLDFSSILWGLDGIWGGFREGFGEGFWRILGCSGLFWVFLGSWGAFG